MSTVAEGCILFPAPVSHSNLFFCWRFCLLAVLIWPVH